jgi:hypothetical protein
LLLLFLVNEGDFRGLLIFLLWDPGGGQGDHLLRFL